LKGYNSKVPNGNWLDNKLGKDSMPLIILSKYADNPLKYIQVREQTTVKCKNLTYSRAITQKWSMRFSWISNLTKIVCLLTIWASMVMILLKIFKFRERTKVKCIILTKSRAITQSLSNTSKLAKNFKMKTVGGNKKINLVLY